MSEIINYFISGLIMIVTPIIFARIILNEKIEFNIIKIIIAIICATIFTILLNNYMTEYVNGTIKMLGNCLIYILLFSYLYKIKYTKSILLTFIFVILLMIPDMLELIVATELLNYSREYCYEVLAGSILSNLIICISTLIISFLLKKPLRKLVNYKLETNVKIIIFSVLTLICIAMLFYNFINIFEINGNIIGFLIAIVVFLTILFSLFKQKIDNNKLTMEYDKLLEFMQTYEKEIENQRILRHESKNQLITIKSKVYDNDKKNEVIKYIDSILEDENAVFNKEKYAKYKYLPANGLKALFYFKTLEAEKEGIDISINVSEKIEKSFLGKLTTENFKKIGRIIGVYFDNAIEASMISKEKELGIEIYKKNNDIEIIISNTYIGDLDNERIGNKVFSTKGKNRGHGLMLVKSIVNSTDIFETKKEITDKLYIQKLLIKKPIIIK